MKEQRFFYCPEPGRGELPEEEARHALRVLRLEQGDDIWLMDGNGHFIQAVITEATGHRCRFREVMTQTPEPEWRGHIHLAMAPTKHIDRTEWMAEKATEIGMDELSFLDCRFSERHNIKSDRIDRILVSAMKQSHKALKPKLNDMVELTQFFNREDLPTLRFIAHCYDMNDVGGGQKPLLAEELMRAASQSADEPSVLVLIGPEGDFSTDEVQLAHSRGFRSVSLGSSRLRTETAALVAVHLMRLHCTPSLTSITTPKQ